MRLRRIFGGAAVTCIGVAAWSGTAFAHQCKNASRDTHAPGAGAQIVFGDGPGGILSVKNGLLKRIEHGLINPDTGEGFHGLIGFENADGSITTTYIVGPEHQLPLTAQQNGSPTHGIVNMCGDIC